MEEVTGGGLAYRALITREYVALEIPAS